MLHKFANFRTQLIGQYSPLSLQKKKNMHMHVMVYMNQFWSTALYEEVEIRQLNFWLNLWTTTYKDKALQSYYYSSE